MPIKSYLVHPCEGKKQDLAGVLANMEYCEVMPAENRELLILVTDTPTRQEEEALREHLEKLEGVKLLALVSGFDTPKDEEYV